MAISANVVRPRGKFAGDFINSGVLYKEPKQSYYMKLAFDNGSVMGHLTRQG